MVIRHIFPVTFHFGFEVIRSVAWSHTWLQPLDKIEIPKWAVDDQALSTLCEHGLEGLDSVQPSSYAGDFKAERDGAKQESKDANISMQRDQANLLHNGPVKVIKRPPLSDSNIRPPKQPKQEPQPQEPPARQVVASEHDDEAQTIQEAAAAAAATQKDTLVEAVGQVLGTRAARKRTKDEEIAAKNLLKKCGLDFNSHWQPAHTGKAARKGHWKEFLMALRGYGDITCDICQRLITKFGVDGFDAKLVAVPDPPQPSEPEIQAIQDDPDVPVISPPRKRPRQGRPKKTEVVEFDLLAYLQEERPNMYRFLDEAEALSRLPDSKLGGTNSAIQEMAKRPVHCELCGGFFHLPRLTNTIALTLTPRLEYA